MPIKDKRGIATYLVLAVLIIAVVLAGVVLNIILSQSSVAGHRQNRIQAYYAAQAAMNYALEMLRTGGWVLGANCTNASPCYPDIGANEVNVFPASILDTSSNTVNNNRFRIIFCNSGQTCLNTTNCNPPAGYTYCVDSTVKYTAP